MLLLTTPTPSYPMHLPTQLQRVWRLTPLRRFTQRHYLDLQDLSNFEVVNTQYRHHGLVFEGAIALRPSNPSFTDSANRLVLMPFPGCKTIRITLDRPLNQVSLWVKGFKPINLTALDQSHHCLTHCTTSDEFHRQDDRMVDLPVQLLAVHVHRITTLVIESSSPFVLAGIGIGG